MKFRVFPSQLAEQPRKRKKAREASLSLCAEAEKAPVFFLFPKKVEAENASHHSLTQNFFFKFFQESFCGWSVLCRSQRTVCAVLQRRREREREKKTFTRFSHNFYGRSLPPSQEKKETRARAFALFSRRGNLEGFDCSSRGRAGNSRRFVSPFLPSADCAKRERERRKRYTFFCDVSLHIKGI